MVKATTLYLCYFPLGEPLVQTQVLPYLRALVADGIEPTLLTFETAEAARDTAVVAAAAEELAAEGIRWHHRRYHKRPSLPATLFDIVVGAWFVHRRVGTGPLDVLHARSHVPAVMAVLGRGAARRHRSRKVPSFLFDVRGFLAEEYVDAGLWSNGGLLFKGMKRAERALLRRADGLVVLSERAREILSRAVPSVPIEVIPCCVDLALFPQPTPAAKTAAKQRLGLAGRRVVLYVGSTTGFYQFDEMVQFARAASLEDSSTFFLVLTQRHVEQVAAQIAASGMARDQFSVRSVAPHEVPENALAGDLALSFIPATYSKLASSPTKVAEYLACGVPVVATPGVGDIDGQLTGEGVGVLVRSHSPDGYSEALARLKVITAAPDIARRCRQSAARLFDLATVGGPRYVGLYHQLLEASRSTTARSVRGPGFTR